MRDDINIEYDPKEQPKSWDDLKEKVRETFHPGLDGVPGVPKEGDVTSTGRVISEINREK